MKNMIAIAGTAGLPAAYGGFETLAENLVAHLGDRYDFTVYCKRTPRGKRKARCLGARLVYIPFHSNGWQSLPYDILSLMHAFFTADVILYLGPVAGMVMPFGRLFRKTIIVNFGGLNEWEREKLNPLERKYMLLSCRLCARFATIAIADNFILQKSIENTFGIKAIVIRYGGDHVRAPEHDFLPGTKYPFLSEPYFVSVARAQVDNNLHVLIDAFKGLPDKKLVLISNWSVSKYGRKLYEANRNIPNLFLLPAIYDPTELNYLRTKASAYIHSHSYCGTAPSLVEAICLGLPIISWDVPTNRETTQGHALFFNSLESLQELINKVTEGDLDSVRVALRPLAANEYTWDRICRQYAALFDRNADS